MVDILITIALAVTSIIICCMLIALIAKVGLYHFNKTIIKLQKNKIN